MQASVVADGRARRTFDVEPAVFELLTEMARNPATVKAWRAQVGDAFADNRFFNAPPDLHARWKPLIQALMSSEKERLVELTGELSYLIREASR